jgi:hypothetical protein
MAEKDLKINVKISKTETGSGGSSVDPKIALEKEKALNKERLENLKSTLKGKESLLKADIAKTQTLLKSAKDKELEAERFGNQSKIKEAIQYRKIVESQLRVMEADLRLHRSKDLADHKAALREKAAADKQYAASIRNAPRTKLAGEIGSLGYVQQLQNKQAGMLPGSQEFTQTGALITRYKAQLTAAGVDVRSLSQKIGGEFTESLNKSRTGMLVSGASIIYLIGQLRQLGTAFKNALNEGAQFGVYKDNFTSIAGGVEQAREQLELLRSASTGNLDEQELILYTNKMRLLGFSVKDTAELLDLIDVQSDKVKIGFQEGEKVLQNYILTGRSRSLKELAINVTDVNKAIKEQTGLTEEQVKKLDDETAQRVRLNGILALNIGTVGDLNNKQKDNADKIKSVETALKNVTLNYQLTVANGIIKYSEALGISDKSMESTIGKVGFVGKSLTDLLPLLVMIKIAFPAAFASVLPVLGAVGLQIGGLILLVKSFTDSIPAMVNAYKFAQDVISGENIGESFQRGVDRHEKQQNPKTSEELGIDVGNKYVEGVIQGIQDRKKEAEEKANLMKDIKSQMDALDKKKTGSKTKKEKEEELNLIKLQEIELAKLQKQLQANLGDIGAELDLKMKIRDVEREIKRLREGDPFKPITPKIPGQSGNEAYQGVGISRRGGNFGRDAEFEQAKRIQEIYNQIDAAYVQAFEQSFSIVQQIGSILGDGASDIINAFQQAYSLTQAIIALINTMNTIASLFDVIPGVGSALKAVARADGGKIDKGMMYQWNEAGKELFIASQSGYVLNAHNFAKFTDALSTMGAAMAANNRANNYVNMYQGKIGQNNNPVIVKNYFSGELSALGSYKALNKGSEISGKRGGGGL